MKLSINEESASALRELATVLPSAISNITESTIQVVSVYQSVSDNLGEHRQSFFDMLMLIKKAQEESAEAIAVLPKMLCATADKIDSYIASLPSRTLDGKSVGADGEIHTHSTNITFSEPAYKNGSVVSFYGDRNSAFAWGTKHFGEWFGRLSKEQITAIQRYSGPEYDALNTVLRSGTDLDNNLEKLKSDIHSALIETAIPEDVTIYRALSENALREMALYCCQDNIQEGCSFTDSAMMSCSLANDSVFNRSPANKYIFRLTAVAGVHAGYIEEISLNQGEHEILVDTDHSIYVSGIKECLRSEITNRSEDTDTITVIDGILTI